MRHLSTTQWASSATPLLIVAVLLSVWIAPVAAAAPLTIDADRQFRYAQSRLDSGAYDEAIAEFNRFIHFFPNDARVRQAAYQVGVASFKAGQYQRAAAVFGAISEDDHDEKLQAEAFFMLSRSHARQGMTEQAMVDLHNLMAISTRASVINQARYELGWLHVDAGQWEPARRVFEQIDPMDQERYRIGEVNSALARHDRIAAKDPVTAGLLSIIPGAGQAYCGRYQDALAALLINAGLILSAWEAFDNDLYALGGVISFVEFGFYSGNIYGAVSSAHKFNRDRSDAFRNDLYRRKQPPLSLSAVSSGVSLCLKIDF